MPDSSTALFFAGLAAVVVAARYFLAQSNSTSSQSGSSTPSNTDITQPNRSVTPREVTEDMVSIVSVLVPHIDRATIRADLEETRSVEATSVRLLDQQKQQKSGGAANEASAAGSASSAVGSTDTAPAAEKPADWFNDRRQREMHMKQQREQMIARARQRTLELAQQEKNSS